MPFVSLASTACAAGSKYIFGMSVMASLLSSSAIACSMASRWVRSKTKTGSRFKVDLAGPQIAANLLDVL